VCVGGWGGGGPRERERERERRQRQREKERDSGRKCESEKLMDEYGKDDIKMQQTKIK
jgi:hypothetical protein